MSINNRRELSLLNHEEGELIRASHHPAIAQLDSKGLADTRKRLRDLRDKERTLARQKVREVRGKGEPRGGGTADHLQERKQVFASALRRVNKQAHRMQVEAARAAHIEASKTALAMRRAAGASARPAPGKTAGEGMNPVESTKTASKVAPAKVGSVSQATKNAQAKRDNA
ncbi:hypothetical protein [Phenylobacterium sp.]|uniref:hypothetical protein n=1 Tax=Phenylobacterium sp. TaxID=1871053 RepID=UPI00289E2187|nr:hypothetical protein [Phenylobacterium sp.]